MLPIYLGNSLDVQLQYRPECGLFAFEDFLSHGLFILIEKTDNGFSASGLVAIYACRNGVGRQDNFVIDQADAIDAVGLADEVTTYVNDITFQILSGNQTVQFDFTAYTTIMHVFNHAVSGHESVFDCGGEFSRDSHDVVSFKNV